MHSYIVSLLTFYSPILELTYFSSNSFEFGDVVEVFFGNRKLKAVILEQKSLQETKFEIRKANFKTQKILSSKNLFSYNASFLKDITLEAKKQSVAVGEILWYLFEDFEPKPLVESKLKDGEAKIFFNNLSFEKEKSENNKLENLHKPKDFIKEVLEGFSPKKVFLRKNFFGEDILPTRPHLTQLPILQIFCKHFLPNALIRTGDNEEHKARKFFIDRVIDVNTETKSRKIEKTKLLSDEAVELINQETRNDKKVFIFVLNHGYALRLYCNDCGKYRQCPICKQPEQYVVDNEQKFTLCKECNLKKFLNKDALLLCEYCGSYNLNNFGLGIKKVGEYIQEKLDQDVAVVDEQDKKITDKNLIKTVNSSETKVVVGTLRAVRAYNEKYDSIFVVSLGKLNSEDEARTYQQQLLLDELLQKTHKLYIERFLSSEPQKNIEDKSFVFWENYKSGKKIELIGRNVTIAVSKKNIKFILNTFSVLKPTTSYVKGSFMVYIFLNLEEESTVEQLVSLGRAYGDVYVGELPREFTFTLK